MKKACLFLVLIFLALLPFTAELNAQIPRLLSYQGVLTDAQGNPAPDGDTSFTFRLYEAASGGTAIWEETKTLTLRRGLFSTMLGDVTQFGSNVLFNKPYWLGIQVETDPELSPRIQLGSVAYSLRSVNADTAAYALGSGGGPYLPLAGGTMTGAITSTGNPPITMGKGNFGSGNTNTGADAFVAGASNAASGNIAAIGGGLANTASGGLSTVGGGAQNVASGSVATVDGGGNNIASGEAATVGGGGYNIASNLYATVAGGSWNRARGQYSVVSGGGGAASGDSNSALGDQSAVGGGQHNTASGGAATVGGGLFNTASGGGATVGGGNRNTASNFDATVGGGLDNIATGYRATIGGGERDSASGDHATVSGGWLNTAFGVRSTVGGGQNNRASADVTTVGGGLFNTASGGGATVGGGNGNTASNFDATVAGGIGNNASGYRATISGGESNTASVDHTTIGGGRNNAAGFIIDGTKSGNAGTVSGGEGNSALGDWATVPGGQNNSAGGAYSFAAGRRALTLYPGTFVWADWTDATFASTGENQFLIRASGGVGIGTAAPAHPLHMGSGAHVTTGGVWTNASDMNMKENFQPVNGEELLEKIAFLPISQWNYKKESPEVKHIGPTAQDFYAAFGLGNDDKTISTIDPAGIALAAIQELHKQMMDYRFQIAEYRLENEKLVGRLAELEAIVKSLTMERKDGEKKPLGELR